MEFKHGMIIKNSCGNYWCQYVKPHVKEGFSIVYTFDDVGQIDNGCIDPLPLPVGLMALGFIDTTPINIYPKVHKNEQGQEVIETKE